jgi:hypothetical protein
MPHFSTLRRFRFSVQRDPFPLEIYELESGNYEDARREAAARYRRKYTRDIFGPTLDIRFENPDA